MKLDRVIAVRNAKTVFRDGNLCIKVFNADYSKADVLNEAFNLSLAEGVGLSVPKLVEVSTFDGKWAIVSEYISGKTLSQLIKDSPSKKDEYINFLVDLQIKVQSLSCPLLAHLEDKQRRKIEQAKLDKATKEALLSRLEELPRHRKLCHGDFSVSNIVISDDGTPYILDWSHAAQGNASADAAKTFLNFMISGDLDGALNYLDLFCGKSNTERRYAELWTPIVAAAQTVNANKEERDFLLKWITVPHS